MATDKSYSGAYIIILFLIINSFLSGTTSACERVATLRSCPRTHERACGRRQSAHTPAISRKHDEKIAPGASSQMTCQAPSLHQTLLATNSLFFPTRYLLVNELPLPASSLVNAGKPV
jgi:hypothetical protein